MNPTGTWGERDIDDAILEFDQHVVSQFAIVEAIIAPRYQKSPIENFLKVRKIITMIGYI